MLISADSFEKLDFSALMEVYVEGNVENGAYFWPEETPERQMELAVEKFRSYLTDSFYGKAHGTYYAWTEKGHYVSALRLERHPEGLLMEALETCPACRRLGYAKKLIMAVLAQLPAGTRIYSHVHKENVPSLTTHQSCGFSKARDYVVCCDGTIRDDEVTMEIVL